MIKLPVTIYRFSRWYTL